MLEGVHGCQVMVDRSIRKESNASIVAYYYSSDIEAMRDRLIGTGYKPGPIKDMFSGLTEFRVKDSVGNEVWVCTREAPA